MKDIKQLIDNTLLSFTKRKDEFSELDVGQSLQIITKNLQKSEISKEVFSDIIAFEFSENYDDPSKAWGLYFGPKWILGDEKGNTIEFPSLDQVDVEIIEAWKARAKENLHPVLLAQYNLLVWEFTHVVSGHTAEYMYALNAIDNTILSVQTGSYGRYENAFHRIK